MRNIGHELQGPRVLRRIEKARACHAGAQAPTPSDAQSGGAQGLYPLAYRCYAVGGTRRWRV
eukprot:3750641-Pyramimonas_sp.AAC.1